MPKIKVLLYTRPLPDGLGDLYSAKRMKELLEEENPEWEIHLLIEKLTASKPTDKIPASTINTLAENLSTIIANQAVNWCPDVLVRVAGSDYIHFPSKRPVTPFLFQYQMEAYKQLPHKAFIHTPSVLEVNDYNTTKKQNYDHMFMQVTKKDKASLLGKEELGSQLPYAARCALQKGNYFFSYGRDQTNGLYIAEIIKTTASSRKPVYIIMPGAREIKLDPTLNLQILDYNTGQCLLANDKTDAVLIRGKIDHTTFMSLISHSAMEHVLVTGDMSLTEALCFGKLPLYDYNINGFADILYGQYAPLLCFNPGDELPSDLGETFRFLSNQEQLNRAKTFVLEQYNTRAFASAHLQQLILNAYNPERTLRHYTPVPMSSKRFSEDELWWAPNYNKVDLISSLGSALWNVSSTAKRLELLMGVDKEKFAAFCDVKWFCYFLKLLDPRGRLTLLQALEADILSRYAAEKEAIFELLTEDDRSIFSQKMQEIEEKKNTTKFQQIKSQYSKMSRPEEMEKDFVPISPTTVHWSSN